jgi:hypothetical protein
MNLASFAIFARNSRSPADEKRISRQDAKK